MVIDNFLFRLNDVANASFKDNEQTIQLGLYQAGGLPAEYVSIKVGSKLKYQQAKNKLIKYFQEER